MKKILLFVLSGLLFSIAVNAKIIPEKKITHIKTVHMKKSVKNFTKIKEDNNTTEQGKNLKKIKNYDCYSFGYERQCMDPGYCIEYTLCGSNFSDIWQAHIATDAYLFGIDCGIQ